MNAALIGLVTAIVEAAALLLKLATSSTPDPEAERQALLHAQRLISDELARRELGA